MFEELIHITRKKYLYSTKSCAFEKFEEAFSTTVINLRHDKPLMFNIV